VTTEDQGPTSRERVVSAATELFVRDGYRSTSMKAIAEHVGVSPPALYWHFPSKRELYLTSMESVLDDFVDYVAAHVRSPEPGEQLIEFVTAHVNWRLERREAAGAFTAAVGSRDLLHSFPAPHRGSLVAKQRIHLDRLGAILAAGRDAGLFQDDSRVTAFAIITMCDYVSSWYDPSGQIGPARVAELYASSILQMLGGPSVIDAAPART
jgi:AcrR family transcriptional regulator